MMRRVKTFLLFLPCVLYVMSRTSASSNFCYYGSNVNTLGALQNQSCTDGEIHLANDLKRTDYQSTPSTKAQTPNSNSASATTSVPAGPKHSCFVFRHIVKQTLTNGMEIESVKVEYGCDFKKVCEGKPEDTVLLNATMDDQQGKLYCCSSNNCNTNERIPHPPAENRLCYTGPVNKSGRLYAELTSCGHPDTICAKSVLFRGDGTKVSETLYCDESQQCQKQLSSGAYRSYNWKVRKANNMTEQLWCCDVQTCFKPQWPILSKAANGSMYGGTDTPRLYKPAASDKGKNDLVVVSLVLTLLLVCSVGGGVLIVVLCRRREQGRDPNVIMQYERLSNSDIDMSEAVIL